MKNTICLSILLCLVLAACNKKEKPEVITERISLEEVTTKPLQMETLLKLPDPYPVDFHMINDTLITLLSEKDASLLRIMGIEEKTIRPYYFRKYEQEIPISDNTSLKAPLHIFHTTTNIFYEYEIEGGVLRLDHLTRLRLGKRSPKQAVKVDDDLFAGIGPYPEGLWGLCRREKREIYFFGDYPIKQEYASNSYLDLFKGSIAKKENQLVYAAESFGFISSYTYANEKMEKQWEKQLADFQIEERTSRVLTGDQHTSGFQDIYMTDKYIYGLYNGYTKHTSWDDRMNSILVFDRDGTLLARYSLPDEMVHIAVDSQDRYLYATYLHLMNDSYLVRFALPALD